MTKSSEYQPSPFVKNVYKKVNEELLVLGGLTDQHVKFITFFVKEQLKIDSFRFELKYLETPKRFIVHVYTNEGQEVWCKPKPADILDKMAEYLKINKDWRIEFAKRT